MTVPVPRPSSSLSNRMPEGFSRSEGKGLARRENSVIGDGIVAATRVQARGFVTSIGIQSIGMLSREADFQTGGDPHVAARVNLLIDQFTMAVANEIGRM